MAWVPAKSVVGLILLRIVSVLALSTDCVYNVLVGQAPAHIKRSLMTTRHKLLSSIVHEYVVKNDDLDGFVDDLLIYFPDIDEDILDDWANDLRN